MVSLEDSESKALAQVLSNDTSRAIMKFMTLNDKATESDISAALKLPLSTVHYNLQNLVASKLVKATEFHYSEKGKEVLHYTLSNKIIVIAPSREETFRLFKRVAPVAILVAGLGLGVHLLTRGLKQGIANTYDLAAGAMPLLKAAPVATAPRVAENFTGMAQQSEAITLANSVAASQPFYTNLVFWFVIGAVVAVAFDVHFYPFQVNNFGNGIPASVF